MSQQRERQSILYPNPVNNTQAIKISNDKLTEKKTSNLDRTEIRLYKKMLNLQKQKIFHGNKTRLNFSNLKLSAYIPQIISGNKNFKKEIMISN